MHWTAAEIRRRRELAGLKQSELADRIGASRRTVAAWEGEENTPSGRWIPKLEEVIGDAALPRPGGGPRPVLLDEADLGQTIGRLVTIYREMIGGRLPFDLESGLLTRGEQDAQGSALLCGGLRRAVGGTFDPSRTQMVTPDVRKRRILHTAIARSCTYVRDSAHACTAQGTETAAPPRRGRPTA